MCLLISEGLFIIDIGVLLCDVVDISLLSFDISV